MRPRTGSGAPSRCPAASCRRCASFGSNGPARTNISARSSTNIWPGAARPSGCGPGNPMWTSARSPAIARRSRGSPKAASVRAGAWSWAGRPGTPRTRALEHQRAFMTTIDRLSPDEIRRRAEALGPWFHNIDLFGVKTAPDHFLGDYPAVKWRQFAHVVPRDLTGLSVLDIGCNGGFYAIEMKRRGAARVLGIDADEDYLAQARFAAEVTGQEIEFRPLSVYDVGALGERFDVVIFMGVLYHLRHPLLALDLIHEHVAKDLMVFQSMQRGSKEVAPVRPDYDFFEMDHFDQPGYPKLHFIEHEYADDPTNWWAPNAACVEAMLRSAGFEILMHPEDEVYVCRRVEAPYGPGAVYPAAAGERRRDLPPGVS